MLMLFKTGRYSISPCDLTCRASTNTGNFISWLSARMYMDYFSKKENLVLDEQAFETRPVDLGLDYIKNARIELSYVQDFINKTLIIDFKAPMTIVSTLEGQRTGIETVGNHYFPPRAGIWAIVQDWKD